MASEAPRGLFAESRPGKFGRTILFVVVFAAMVTAAVWVSIDNARDKPTAGLHGITLTANEAHGRELFAHTCSTCHSLAAAAAVARIGPDLDVLIGGIPKKARYAVVRGAIMSGFAGQGQMPANIYVGQDAKDVAQFVSAVAGK
jgi:mono/diheme cytochrome c family protein